MSILSSALKKTERSISNVVPHAHSAQKRADMAAATEQLSFYKNQKDALQKEGARVSAERDTQRQRLHEKQIRSMRRTFRSPGFMEGPREGTSDTVG